MFFIYVGGPNLFIYFSCVILFVTRWKQKFCCASCSRISTLSWTWLSRLTWWSWRVWGREAVPGWHWRHAVTQIDTVWGLDVVPGWHWHHAVTQIDTVWWRCVCVWTDLNTDDSGLDVSKWLWQELWYKTVLLVTDECVCVCMWVSHELLTVLLYWSVHNIDSPLQSLVRC